MIVTYNKRFFGITRGFLFEARSIHRNIDGSGRREVSVDIPEGVTRAKLKAAINRCAFKHDIIISHRHRSLCPVGVIIFTVDHIPTYLIEQWSTPISEIPYKAGSKADWYHSTLVAGGRIGEWKKVWLRPGDDTRLARIAIANVCRDKKRSFRTMIGADGSMMFMLVA